MSVTKFNIILLDTSPKKINKAVEQILDVLFEINNVVISLNSIDFCNPLGYILTRALPPGGIIEQKLNSYGSKVTKFINNSTQKIDLSNDDSDSTANKIEEIRLDLEGIIPEQELIDVIPGGSGILTAINLLNASLVTSNNLSTPSDNGKKIILIKAFLNRLTPLMNPISITELLISSRADDLNEKLRDIIKPERFRSDLLRIIKLVISIDKAIVQIRNIVSLISKILKTLNILIKVFRLASQILKVNPAPAQFATVGAITTSSSTASKYDRDIDDLSQLIKSVTNYLDNTVILQIKRIRTQIFILLVGLEQLYQNILACPYTKDDILSQTINDSITSLQNNLLTLDTLFPQSTITDNNESHTSLYQNYNITIIKEEVVDRGIRLFRRRVVVSNQVGIVQYEGTPTYASDDQVLIKEGQLFIDKKLTLLDMQDEVDINSLNQSYQSEINTLIEESQN